ncbi:acireductone synthase [Sulfurihydrogenibium azorense]|uniref:acireductone synthase n=1 Tax=Sulfurihydrogenibium azorense TaxID=309806 RepID=UPI002409361C|nr:acireductone synthase [Sulfurihydrogenibium azorense]MDM7274042.1 acireductone synthase [Sulfurihydrogenibium azorense]
MVKAVLTDIEGTITPISFVKDVLFPYSYENIQDFILKNKDNPLIIKILEDVKKVEGKELSLEEIIQTLKRWIEEDRKITPLKEIQGLIWEEGYKSGKLKGYVYPDAYEKLKHWYENAVKLYVYSSGSVKAQKLLFSNTNFGDLNYLFSGYFDTNIGNKKEPISYTKITQSIGLNPDEILFLSDNPDEIMAAAKAGMKVVRLVRPKDAEYIKDFPYPQVESFNQIDLTVL